MQQSPDLDKSNHRSRPGRPRGFNREQVLDRALDIFWRQGFSLTTTRDLETVLALNQSSLYNSFGSKQQFFNVVLDRYESLTQAKLLEPLESTFSGVKALKHYFDELSQWILQGKYRGCMLINLLAEDGGNNPAFTARIDQYRQRVDHALYSALQRASESNEIVAGDNRARATILLGLALGINISARGGATRVELDRFTRAVIQQIDSWRIDRTSRDSSPAH